MSLSYTNATCAIWSQRVAYTQNFSEIDHVEITRYHTISTIA